MEWTIAYTPGPAYFLVCGRSAVLLPADATAELRARLWAEVRAETGILDLLDVLSEHGRAALPEAAMVVEEEAGCVALLRGRISISHGETLLDGAGRYTWTESQVHDDEITLLAGAEQAADAESLPIVSGVVRVHSVQIRRSPAAGSEAGEWQVPAPDAALPAAARDEPVPASEQPTSTAPGWIEVPPAQSDGPTLDQREQFAAPPSGSALAGEEPDDSAEPGEDDEAYDRLFGVTSLFRAPAGPAEDQTQELAVPEALAPGEDRDPVATHDESSPAAPEPDSGAVLAGGLIDFVPGAEPRHERSLDPGSVIDAGPRAADAWPGPPVTETPGPVEDPESLTVRREALYRPAAPTVRAIVCERGHANPPEVVACRVCGLDVGDLPVRTIARPPIGRLTLLGAVGGAPEAIDLDGSVVIGRRPSLGTGVEAGDRFLTLDVAGGEISRNHVRIGVEGWHVLVTDLGSTNGTVVTLPGAAPVRLRRGEPVVIVPEALVEIADSISYRYEVV